MTGHPAMSVRDLCRFTPTSSADVAPKGYFGVVVAFGSVGARWSASRPYIAGLRRACTALRIGLVIEGMISATAMPCAPGGNTSGFTTGA
jgi:hypothetical protein